MPPRLLLYLAIAAVAGFVPLFFVDLGPYRRIFAPELHAFGHLMFFAGGAWIILQTPLLRRHSYPFRAITVLLAALVVGSLIEIIQPYFGRSAALKDVGQNVLGAAITVSLSAPRGMIRRLLITAVGILLFMELHAPVTTLFDRGVARVQFPVLSDFSTAFEHRRWSSGKLDTSIARSGRRSLRLELRPSRYAGTTLRRSLGNWTRYQALEFSIYNPDGPLGITVSVSDHAHFEGDRSYKDRFNRRFLLQPGWNDISIPISHIRDAPAERTQHLDDLAELAIFTSNLEEPRVLFLDSVRLTE